METVVEDHLRSNEDGAEEVREKEKPYSTKNPLEKKKQNKEIEYNLTLFDTNDTPSYNDGKEEIKFQSLSNSKGNVDNSPFGVPKQVFRKLKEGEESAIQRTFSENGHFNFFAKDLKIDSVDDIAFLFRQLETASVEHAFIFHETHDGKYIVQHLTTGTATTSLVDPQPINLAIKEFNSKKVYLVHNHPSGNLEPSDADYSIVARIKRAVPEGVEVGKGIIIDLLEGRYSTFDTDGRHTEGRTTGEAKVAAKKLIHLTNPFLRIK